MAVGRAREQQARPTLRTRLTRIRLPAPPSRVHYALDAADSLPFHLDGFTATPRRRPVAPKSASTEAAGGRAIRPFSDLGVCLRADTEPSD